MSIRLENPAKPAFLTRCDSIFQLKLSYRRNKSKYSYLFLFLPEPRDHSVSTKKFAI